MDRLAFELTQDNATGSLPRPLQADEVTRLSSAFSHLECSSVLELRHTPVERFVDRALSFGAAWDGRPEDS
jgi:hypothetical protein